MLEKIAKLDAAVIKALLLAFVGLIGVVAGLFGVDEVAFGAKASRLVDSISTLLIAGGLAWAAYARVNLPTPPISDKAVQKTRELVSKQGGFVRLLLLAALLGLGAIAVTLSGCAGTRAAYAAADTPSDYALVVLEQYDAVLVEANRLKASGRISVTTLAAIRAADLKAQPFIDTIRPLQKAYESTHDSADAAALQKSVNDAIVAVAELIRTVKSARGGP